MPAKRAPDGVDLADDGTIRLVIDGTVHRLRRPKIGELRGFFEGVTQVAEAEAKSEGDPLGAMDVLADWWRNVVDTLAGDEDPRLSDDTDELPVWLLSGTLIARALVHWREVPYLSGG
jgi:hypothetical protein